MSGTRFWLLTAGVAAVVAVASFAAGLAVLDDGQPEPPPRRSGDATSTTPPPIVPSTATTAAATVPAGDLPAPAWIVVVASESSEDAARSRAEAVAARGHPTGVLHSDDYPTLNPGLWVAFAGPYPDRSAADAAADALEDDGVAGAYVRCAGTRDECGGGGDDEDED